MAILSLGCCGGRLARQLLHQGTTRPGHDLAHRAIQAEESRRSPGEEVQLSGYLKIGELARMTGVTVRTLQHYDRIGLLKPAKSTESGHRLYDEQSVRELYCIAALKQLGLTLSEIKQLRESADVDLRALVDLQLTRLEEEIAERHRLMRRLVEVKRRLDVNGRLSLDDFQALLYFVEGLAESRVSPGILERLKEARDRLGRQPDLVVGWSGFIDKLKECCARNLDHTHPDVRWCVEYWRAFVAQSLGSDRELHEAAAAFHASKQGERLHLNFGLTEELYRYLLDQAKVIASASAGSQRSGA